MIAAALVFANWWPALVGLGMLVSWVRVAAVRRMRRRRDVLGLREEKLLGAPRPVWLRRGCGALAACLCGVSLLGPVWGEAPGEPFGPDLLVCLDVSRSMRARDVAPDRLGAAQQEIASLAAPGIRPRLGLVLFAGTAELVVPLTNDLESAAVIAAGADPSRVAKGGSDLGAAIEVAAAALARSGSRVGAIVLMTDGEDFGGQARQAATRAHAAGVPVYCLGFGSAAGSKIVVETTDGETFLRDRNGRDVVTALDPDSLTAVAVAGGGTFSLAVPGALSRLYAEELLPRAQAVAVHDDTREQAHRFQWLLLAALLLWMLRSVLPERHR